MAGPDASAGSEPFGPPPWQDCTRRLDRQRRRWAELATSITSSHQRRLPLTVCVAKSRMGMPGSRNYECATLSYPSSDSAARAGRPARQTGRCEVARKHVRFTGIHASSSAHAFDFH
ncbi:hypothetical protein MRX96_041555 [Rhipicephalus microplus]